MKRLTFIIAISISLSAFSQDTLSTTVSDSTILQKKVIDFENYSITVYELKYTPRDSIYIIYYDTLMNQKALEFFCENDTCYNYQYYESGALKQITKYYPKIVDSSTPMESIYFSQKLFCENGQLITIIEPKQKSNPTMLTKRFVYYCSGNIMDEFMVDSYNFFPEGEYITYYENGNIKEKGNYEKGFKTGRWKYYSETGKLKKEEGWKKGKLEKTKEYDEQGKLIKTLTPCHLPNKR